MTDQHDESYELPTEHLAEVLIKPYSTKFYYLTGEKGYFKDLPFGFADSGWMTWEGQPPEPWSRKPIWPRQRPAHAMRKF